MWRSAWVGMSLACLGACQSAFPSAHIDAPFDPKAAAFAMGKGTGEIDGQAFLRRDFGRLVTAAGERVFLIPATPYAVERFSRMFGGDRRSYFGNDVEAPPEGYYDARRETKVDMRGRFTFPEVPAGRYIVATRVFWTEPKSFFTHGGAMYDTVDVKDNEVTTAIISGK